MRVARDLSALAERVPGGIVFKASFDKANRSNRRRGTRSRVRRRTRRARACSAATGLPMITDVHLPDQCARGAEVVDALQIPAFLCRQTDLLAGRRRDREAGERQERSVDASRRNARRSRQGSRSAAVSGKPILKRRGRCDRARNLLRLRRSRRRHARLRANARRSCDAPVIFDATHSVQRPGMGRAERAAARANSSRHLALAAVAAGADGLFIETHPDPDNAPSDGPNMLPLADLERLARAARRCLGEGGQ